MSENYHHGGLWATSFQILKKLRLQAPVKEG